MRAADLKPLQKTRHIYMENMSLLIYGTSNSDRHLLPPQNRVRRFMEFYGILEPPAPSPPVPQNNASMLIINSIALEGTEPAEFRHERAYRPVWPILYPDPEELPIVVDELLHWISGWVIYIEDHPGSVNVEHFETAILGKVVGVRPVIAGNKRTGRLLAQMIAVKLNASTYVHDFVKRDMRRHTYSYDFARFCWLRDYRSLKRLHREVRARPPKSVREQLDDEFRTLFNTVFFHK